MRRFPLRASLLALLAACLFFYGCAAPAQETGAPMDAAPAPAAPSPAPSPTPRMGNPVWLFYEDFYSVSQNRLDGLHVALAQLSGPAAIDGELILCALEERLTEGMVSFGLLMQADDGGQGYASAVEGAAPGSGVISGKDGIYDLSFAYTEGGVALAGTLTPYRLRYSRHLPEQEAPAYSLLLLRAKGGWAAVLDLGGGPAYVLRCGGEELGLYAIAYGAFSATGPITYTNCAEGAAQSWLYANGELHIQGQGDHA